ncbi:McrC family protein [Dongshaea marina]|uniref:McrC family protein n=1 Tax=Dongshaea marina TaxID=2047966 RepID=UPI0019000BEE|nr:McrC family protein [Dongshaea marina]
MPDIIQIREYASITCDQSQTRSLNLGVVSPATFNWLLELQARWKGRAQLLEIEGKQRLKICSYVGFLRSPTGEEIEILPKTQQHEFSDPGELDGCRGLLFNMLLVAMHLKPREAESAQLRRTDAPVHEWVIQCFLAELKQLINRGLRFDYQAVEEESRFIRGQINLARQSRQTPDRATWFHIQHNIYSPQRRENRLLKTALDYALKLTKSSDNWRLANELAHQLITIEAYQQPMQELPRWQSSKLMKGYDAIKPWCELILEQLNPSFQQGQHEGVALLFAMERLFEEYVSHCLRGSLHSSARLKTQAASKYLLRHQPRETEQVSNWFQLKPDLLLETKQQCSVLDTKWKLLNDMHNTSEHKYGIKQSDIYQLYAYGHKYMQGQGDMMLIYPRHSAFDEPLPVFSFDERLHLWAVPFDLKTQQLVPGEWQQAFSQMLIQ